MQISVGILSALVAMLCWGIADFLTSIPSRKIGSLKTLFWSNILSLIPAAVMLIIFSEQLNISITNVLLLTFGALLLTFGSSNFLRSLEVGEISIVTPISASFSIVTIMLGILILRERLFVHQFVAVFTIVLGIILGSTNLRKFKNLHTVKGVKESLVALVCWGIYFFILGLVSKTMDYISLFVFSGLIASPFQIGYPLIKQEKPRWTDLKTKNILVILLFNTLIYTLAWSAVTYGVNHEKISLVTPVSSLYPLITVILATIFYKEKLVLNQKIGILIILLGLFIINL
ncbi:DMT family transporter [Candidatus Woesearchaeota archaeon]|nr:DMT family transporter [Candidatus Woesearchaeota archaeon]